jgi:double-strand break repair protein MRE11
VKVDKLVNEYLTAQTLTILPQNSFGDAVSQFVNKDDKHAMETFVDESLSNQMKHLMTVNEVEEEEIMSEMTQYREQLEDLFASGQLKKVRKSKIKPKPDGWDSDFEGPWANQPGALIRSDNEAEKDKDDDESLASVPTKKDAPRGRGKAAGTTRATAAATKKAAPAAKGGRGKKKVVEEEEDDEEEDVIMIDDDDDEDDQSAEDLFVSSRKKAPAKKPAAKAPARAKSPVKKTPASRAKAPATQSKLNFSQASTQRSQPTRPVASRAKKVVREPVSDALLSSYGSVLLT